MVRLKNVKKGEKFVFQDEPGVYKKVASDKARCVFGAPHIFDIEIGIGIEPEVEVFVVGEQGAKQTLTSPSTPLPDEEKSKAGTVLVIFEGHDEEVILERVVPVDDAMLMARVDFITLRTSPRRKKEIFAIGDTGLDAIDGILYLEVIDRRVVPAKRKVSNET